jgi:hypothetical protein
METESDPAQHKNEDVEMKTADDVKDDKDESTTADAVKEEITASPLTGTFAFYGS